MIVSLVQSQWNYWFLRMVHVIKQCSESVSLVSQIDSTLNQIIQVVVWTICVCLIKAPSRISLMSSRVVLSMSCVSRRLQSNMTSMVAHRQNYSIQHLSEILLLCLGYFRLLHSEFFWKDDADIITIYASRCKKNQLYRDEVILINVMVSTS